MSGCWEQDSQIRSTHLERFNQSCTGIQVPRLSGTTCHCLSVQPFQLLPPRLMPRNCFIDFCCWTLIRLSRHWAWLRRRYLRYRKLIDWLINRLNVLRHVRLWLSLFRTVKPWLTRLFTAVWILTCSKHAANVGDSLQTEASYCVLQYLVKYMDQLTIFIMDRI